MALLPNKAKYLKSLSVIASTLVTTALVAITYLDSTNGGGLIKPATWVVLSPLISYGVTYFARIIKQKSISGE